MVGRRIINKVIRIVLLTVIAAGMLLYLLGVVTNVFGLLDFKAPLDRISERIAPAGGFVDTLDFDGGRTVYAAVPSRSEVAVFHVHGSPGSLDAYMVYLENAHLQAHVAQYTYDRIGYGDTRPLIAAGSLSVQARQLADLIRHIGAQYNIIVGHSLGCTIAACLAMESPGIVDGLIMVAAPLDPELEPSAWWRPLLDWPVISLAVAQPLKISNRELTPLREELGKLTDRWSSITCPVTFIHGERDELVPVENVTYAMRVMSGAARKKEVILVDEGHFILWSHDELIADEIIELAESLQSSINE